MITLPTTLHWLHSTLQCFLHQANNAMPASGMKFGFVRTLASNCIPFHILQIGLTCFGLANLFLLYPQVQFIMKICVFILTFLDGK